MNVPLDSWVYEALDKLESGGLIDTAVSGTKPYSRLEVARLVKEAMENRERRLNGKRAAGFFESELIPALLGRFKREFHAELVEWGVLEGAKPATFLKPVDEVILRYVVQTGDQIRRPQSGNPPTQTIYPVNDNDGIVYRKGNNFSAEIEGEGRLWNHISFFYRPIFTAFDQEETRWGLQQGYLKLEGLNLELEGGRDSLWWGPGVNSLLMTNNARPFDLVKLSNQRPFVLPFLGPFKFNLFLSKLDTDQPPSIAHPYLYGARLDFKPHPMLEFGASQTVIFGGEGREALSFPDYFKILYSRTDNGTKLASNQMGAFDFAFRWPDFYRVLPVLRSFKVYGEFMIDDATQWAYLVGLSLYDLFLAGRADLRLEYVNTAHHVVPTAVFNHGEYPPVFHERLFGYSGGGNVESIFARINVFLSAKAQMGVDFTAAQQGKKLAPTTNSYQYGSDFTYWAFDQMSVRLRYLLQEFKDPEGIAGGNSTQHFLMLDFRYRF